MHFLGYANADWAGDQDESKLTSGYAFLLSNGAISWRSKKQTCIALSTMEAKFFACSVAVQEVIWLRRIIQSLGIVKDDFGPTTVFSDSQETIAYAKYPKYHGKTKHIDTKNNFIRDIIAQNEVILNYLPSREMIVYPFTKPISKDMFSPHVRSLGLRRL